MHLKCISGKTRLAQRRCRSEAIRDETNIIRKLTFSAFHQCWSRVERLRCRAGMSGIAKSRHARNARSTPGVHLEHTRSAPETPPMWSTPYAFSASTEVAPP